MQVKQRLRMNTAFVALSVIAVTAVLLVTMQRIFRAMEENRIADKIITTAFERVILRTDYLRTGSERAREQVSAKHRQIAELLKTASEKFTDPEDQKTIGALIKANESIGKNFRAIVENREKAASQGLSAAVSQEIEDRLLSQLNIRIYETVMSGGKLQESSTEALVSAIRRAGGGIAFVFLFFGSVTLANSWIMGRTITDRIRRLRDGASAIGGGNLDHSIDVKGDDEFAELAGSFNEMTAKLRTSYHDLEMEIDERKKAEEELRQSQRQSEFLANIVNSSSQSFGVGYPDGRLGLINTAFEHLTGYTGDELRAIDWAVTLTPAEWQEVERRNLEELHRTGGPVRYEKEYIRKDGTRVPIELLVHLATDAEGKPEYYYSFLTDITERKRAEEALRKAHGELEVRIEERTRELKEAQEVLKAVNETLEQRVSDRTGELEAANIRLRDSGRAALNMMEDAVIARRQAEETSIKLQQEAIERRKAEEQIQRHLEQLRISNEELSRFTRASAGRELRMIELKREVNALCEKAGLPPRYELGFVKEKP